MISLESNSDFDENIFQKISSWIRHHSLITSLALFITIKSIILVILLLLFEILGFSVGDFEPKFHTNNTFFDLLGTRWDSYFYLVVAENGQYFDPTRPTDTRVWNFAPLYPFFIRIIIDIGHFFQIDIPVAVAAVIVANIFSLTSTFLFHLVSQLYLSEVKAISATLLFSFFPTTLVFSTVAYAEPVYLTFVIFSWYTFEKKRYATTGIMLALATLARYPGALIFFLYMAIYFGRKVRDQGLLQALGCLIAIPLFPLLALVNTSKFLYSVFKNQISALLRIVGNFESLINLNPQQKVKISKLLHFLDIKLSSILIFGIIPLGWIYYVNITAPIPLAEVTYINWGAKFVWPLAGLFDMLAGGDVKWTLEKFSFAFLFLILGIGMLKKRPSFAVMIIGPTLFYSGYIGVHAWGIPRYSGTIFHGPLSLTEEIISPKIILLVLGFFLLYGFKILWSFTNWNVWLI